MSNILQLVVPSSQTNLILQDLDPDTDYYVNVAALYDNGLGGELERDGRTCMPNFAFQTKYVHILSPITYHGTNVTRFNCQKEL